jgi:NAD-dependent deacetylase sirtuin 4
MQILIKDQNKNWTAFSNQIAPDSDVHLTPEQIKGFSIPICPKCNNKRLKPDLVFFGDNVPKELVNHINENIFNADALLIIGTTVHTFSAYRIVLKAKELKIPVAILSIGPTRADDLADIKISGKCSEALSLIKF